MLRLKSTILTEVLTFHLNFYFTQKQEDEKYETNLFL